MTRAQNIFSLFDRYQNRNLHLVKERCVSHRNRNAGCTRCADACTSKCITVSPEGQLTIEPSNCVACGDCATVCPTSALVMDNPSDGDLLDAVQTATAAAENHTIVCCEYLMDRAAGAIDYSKVVTVPCLGRLDENMLLSAIASGAKKITLVKNQCESCSRNCGVEVGQMVVDNTNALLRAWDQPEVCELKLKVPSVARAKGTSFDSSKRHFFQSMQDEMKQAAKVGADYVVEDKLQIGTPVEEEKWRVSDEGTLPQNFPLRQLRLIKLLSLYGKPDKTHKVKTRLWGQVHIDPDKCETCLMCATFCPTGAISRFEDPDGSFGVTVQPGTCVQCRMCEHICSGEAITVSDEVRAIYLVTGAKARMKMKERPVKMNEPSSMTYTMRNILGVKNVYDR